MGDESLLFDDCSGNSVLGNRGRRNVCIREALWHVVGVDGSAASEAAVFWAARDAAMRNVPLSLVHMLKTFVPTFPQIPMPSGVGVWQEDDGREVLEGRPVLLKCWMFVIRLSHSGKAFHVAFATQAQEAFLEGHVLAFAYFGGVPGRIRYGNLKPAVVRVIKGGDRIESERFTALRSHYGFDSFFCRPGIDGAHEKRGVEGEIGRFRRRHLVPVLVGRVE